MQCRVIILDTTGTPYTFYEIEKIKETIKEKTEKTKTKSKETDQKRKKKKMKAKLEETVCRAVRTK